MVIYIKTILYGRVKDDYYLKIYKRNQIDIIRKRGINDGSTCRNSAVTFFTKETENEKVSLFTIRRANSLSSRIGVINEENKENPYRKDTNRSLVRNSTVFSFVD